MDPKGNLNGGHMARSNGFLRLSLNHKACKRSERAHQTHPCGLASAGPRMVDYHLCSQGVGVLGCAFVPQQRKLCNTVLSGIAQLEVSTAWGFGTKEAVYEGYWEGF